MNALGLATTVAILAGGASGPGVLVIARRTMHMPARVRYVEIIAVTAVAGLLTGLVLVRPPESMVMLLPLAVLGSAAAVVDAYEGRLPDVLTWPLLAVTVLGGVVTSPDASAVAGTVVTVIVGGAAALLMKATVSAACGWGDVKLVPTLAVVLVRHDAVLSGVVTVSALVAVTAVVAGIGAAGRSTLVPYGPAFVLGTVGAAAL